MGSRQDRGRSGPLTRGDVEALFDRGYTVSAHRALSQRWGVAPEDPEALFVALCDEAALVAHLERADARERALLGALASQGGRARAENLRKELLLKGQGDRSDALRALIRRGLVVLLPGSGQSEVDVEQLLEQQSFLQQEIAISEVMLTVLDARGITHRVDEVGAWGGEIASSQLGSTQALDLNLLHLTDGLTHDTLRLNKSGAPNRRSLARFTEGLTRPGDANHHDPWLDVGEADQADYLAFLMALLRELGVTRVVDEEDLVAAHDSAARYFTMPDVRRSRQLLRITQRLKGWSEILSPALAAGRETDDALELQLSQSRDNGQALIGARGHVISMLRRAHLSGWTPLEDVVELCTQLDRDYLPRVLSRAGAEDVDVARYVRALIERPLFWLGLVELGRATDGVALMRLTEMGEQLLGDGDDEAEAPQVGCLIVQPNLEVMTFLDAAPMGVLFRLYQLGERVNLADRVATFRLTAESVQRGYSLGLSSQEALDLLNARSHAPLADSLAFQLRDWERIWRRVTLWARGTLLRHEDPDRLDSIVGQLRHSWRDRDVHFERLSAGAVFIDAVDIMEDLDKQLSRHDGLLIDYLGEVPPSLDFIAPLIVSWAPMHTDIETLGELARWTNRLRDQSTPRHHVGALDVEKIRARWPRDPLAGVTTFLEARTRGGLPPEQALRLRAALESPPRATMRREMITLTLQDQETARLFSSIPQAAELIEARLGPTTFAIPEARHEELEELLELVGVELD